MPGERFDRRAPKRFVQASNSDEPVERFNRLGMIDCAEGANRGGDHAVIAPVEIDQLGERLYRVGITQGAQPPRRQGNPVATHDARKSRQRCQCPDVTGPAERVGDRPPPENRLLLVADHRLGERLVRAHLAQRVQAATKRFHLVRQRVAKLFRVHAERPRDVPANHGADRGRRGRGADPGERAGGAPLHLRRDVAQALKEGIGRCGIADQPERERRHLAHLRLGIRETRDQRLHPFRQSDPSDGERGAPADICLRRREQRKQAGPQRRR